MSILLGVGRHLGSQSRAKTSITNMRAPQRGHGQGSTRGVSGVISGWFCASMAGGATPSNARAVSMLSARLAPALQRYSDCLLSGDVRTTCHRTRDSRS